MFTPVDWVGDSGERGLLNSFQIIGTLCSEISWLSSVGLRFSKALLTSRVSLSLYFHRPFSDLTAVFWPHSICQALQLSFLICGIRGLDWLLAVDQANPKWYLCKVHLVFVVPKMKMEVVFFLFFLNFLKFFLFKTKYPLCLLFINFLKIFI